MFREDLVLLSPVPGAGTVEGSACEASIGSTTSFNLEFYLSYVPEHLELSGPSETLRSSIGTSA